MTGFSAGENGGKQIMVSFFSLEKVPTRSFMLGSDKNVTHSGGNQCTVPLWSINIVLSEEILL